jgi:two-component system, autoinducer 2 sensor kinase/phosphatase LuxQ
LDRQEVIFEPFVRATQTETTKKYAGIGLGLANVKLMVNRMGGSIKLRSIPGYGTTFIIVFPG